MDGKHRKSLDALLEAKVHLSGDQPRQAVFADKDDDDDENGGPAQETKAQPEEVLQYAWETVCYVIWGKASAKVVEEWSKSSGGTERHCDRFLFQ